MTELVLLSILNWAHLFATVAWFGAITTNVFVLLPAVKGNLEPPVAGKLMGSVMKRLRVLVYICMAILIISGIFMTILSPQFEGSMKFESLWSIIAGIKHGFVVLLVVLAIYGFDGLAPKVAKAAAKGPSPELALMRRKQMRLAACGFVLAVVILLLTAVLTAIPPTT